MDFLWLLQWVSCSHSCSAACIAPADVVGASDVVKQLNAYLQTAHHIININSTWVSAVSGSSQWNAMAQLWGWVQQLSGMLSLVLILLLGLSVFGFSAAICGNPTYSTLSLNKCCSGCLLVIRKRPESGCRCCRSHEGSLRRATVLVLRARLRQGLRPPIDG